MSFEDLNNFSALQVPNVYLVILASRNNPFPTRDAEARDDAKLGVGVAYIGF
jgi:hypothetical protein